MTRRTASSALAALMVRLARSDGNYSAGERARIDACWRRIPARPGRGGGAQGVAEITEEGAPDTVSSPG